MAKLFKLPLISLIACALTIGGIFGAWTFSGGGSAGVDSNLTAGTTPTDYWQFNSVSFKFVCDNASSDATLTGEFSDSSTTKTISVHEDAGLTYEQYSGIGKPTCTTDTADGYDYVFSHWAYYKDGKLTHYNLDVGFGTNVTLYAQYVRTTNPAIYLYTSGGFVLQSYMFRNPSNTSEFIANNLLVSENPGTRNNDGSIKEGRDKYVVKKSGGTPSNTSDPDIVWIDDENSNDKVVKGLYNVFYSTNASSISDNPDWKTFGGCCWFQRQYSLSLFGNPTQGWESDLGINAPLGFVSETATTINNSPTSDNPYSDTKVTTYKATKVVFTSEAWLGGNTNYEFKPGDRYFDDIRYPKDGISTYTNNYVEAQTSGSYNYELKDSEQRNNMFDITIEVTYKKYGSNFDTAQYRNFVLCSAHIVEVVPYNYTINYYATKDSEDPVDSESVAYGSNASNFLSDELNHNQADTVGGTMRFVTTWIDKYTGQQFNINTLKEKEITQNLNLYPLYEYLDPITINYKTYSGSWENSQTAYVYNCNPNYTSYYKAKAAPTTVLDHDGYIYKDKWQLELTSEGTQYNPSDIADFDYKFVYGLTGGTELNVFARYEKMGTDIYLKVADNDPIDLTELDDKIVFDDIGNPSDKYSFGAGKYLLGNNSDILYDIDGEENTIGNTGTTGFNLRDGNINVVNFSGKTVPTMKNSSTEIITDRVFLQPNVNWLADNAYFAAAFSNHPAFYQGYAYTFVEMMDNDGDGIYECDVVDNCSTVIFIRYLPSVTEMNYGNAAAYTIHSSSLAGNNRKLSLDSGAQGSGAIYSGNYTWTTMTVTSAESQIVYDAIYLKINSWWGNDDARITTYYNNDAVWYDMAKTDISRTYVGAIPPGCTNVRFRRIDPNTGTSWNNTASLTTPSGNKNCYYIDLGAWDTIDATLLYLKPNSNWTIDGARFAARFWESGGAEKWVDMVDPDGDGYYACVVPSGYPYVIFCRMNPGATANNWNNKWNQTGDLTVPTNGNNLFTVPSGAWDGSTTTWSTY